MNKGKYFGQDFQWIYSGGNLIIKATNCRTGEELDVKVSTDPEEIDVLLQLYIRRYLYRDIIGCFAIKQGDYFIISAIINKEVVKRTYHKDKIVCEKRVEDLLKEGYSSELLTWREK